MTPHVVVDVGNTRIKWGLCALSSTTQQIDVVRIHSLPDDPNAWAAQCAEWQLLPARTAFDWALAGVQPARLSDLRAWLLQRGQRVTLLDRVTLLPLKVNLEYPERTGIDRLLNAVAARTILPAGRGGILIDAGSAVTVDWLDEEHTFQGGCIFPGLDLMAEALHRYTALLPRVAVQKPIPELPAKSTIPAMQVGLFLAISGGIREAVRLYTAKAKTPPRIFFTGGQATLLADVLQSEPADELVLWPEQTLVGILRSVEAMP